MRTKTLLIAAAALAATVISTEAQVYSANIVGYVNQSYTNAGANYFIAAPLGGTDMTVEHLMGGALQPGDAVDIWSADDNNYSTFYYVGPGGNDPDTNTWQDINFSPVSSPTVSAGQGFYYLTTSGNIETNTWTGTVQLTNSTPFTITGGNYAVGSTPPVAGYPDDTGTFNMPLQPGDAVQIWDQGVQNYDQYYYVGPGGNDPATNTWQDVNFAPVNAPYIQVGQGFFYVTTSGNTETWNQNLIVP